MNNETRTPASITVLLLPSDGRSRLIDPKVGVGPQGPPRLVPLGVRSATAARARAGRLRADPQDPWSGE